MPDRRRAPTLALALAALLALPARDAIAQPFPGASRYLPSPTVALAPPPALSAAYDAARSAGAERHRTLVPDASLAAAAQALAEQVARDPRRRQLSYAASRALINAAGLADHDVVYDFWWVPAGAPAPAIAQDLARVMDSARNFAYDHVGAGSASARGGTLLLVALGWRNASLASEVPRFLPVGARIRGSARLGASFHDAWLAVTYPDGRVDSVQLGAGPDVSFDVPTRGAGVYQLELAATGGVGPRPLLNFFVFVGDARPTLPDDLYADTALTESPEQMEANLFARINEARRAAGLAPLRANAVLTAAARGHSADMAQNHFEGHVSPTNGSTADDRVRRAGLRSAVVLENVDGGYSGVEIHGAFMNSPGHRAAILDPHVTDVGVGAVVQHNPDSDIMMVTEDFAEVLAPVDLSSAPALALARVNAARAAANAPALAAHPALSRYADSLARAYFTGTESTQRLQDRARDGLEATGIPYRSSIVQVLSLSSVEDIAQQSWLLNPEFSALGVGIAQGSRADGPANEIIAVLVMVQDAVPAVDPAATAVSVLSEINRQRAAHGAPTLREDPRASAYARAAANGFFQGNEAPQAAQDRARNGFPALGVPYRTVAVQLLPVSSAQEVTGQSWLLRGDLNAAGVGVAQGTRPDTLRNQLVIVLVVYAAR